jgi:hypothetical protein
MNNDEYSKMQKESSLRVKSVRKKAWINMTELRKLLKRAMMESIEGDMRE